LDNGASSTKGPIRELAISLTVLAGGEHRRGPPVWERGTETNVPYFSLKDWAQVLPQHATGTDQG
jgi:hypothetical protein